MSKDTKRMKNKLGFLIVDCMANDIIYNELTGS